MKFSSAPPTHPRKTSITAAGYRSGGGRRTETYCPPDERRIPSPPSCLTSGNEPATTAVAPLSTPAEDEIINTRGCELQLAETSERTDRRTDRGGETVLQSKQFLLINDRALIKFPLSLSHASKRSATSCGYLVCSVNADKTGLPANFQPFNDAQEDSPSLSSARRNSREEG